MKRHTSLLILVSFAFVADARVIIFDLGDTLMRVSHAPMMRAVGLWRFTSFLLADCWHSPFAIKQIVAHKLDQVLNLYQSSADAETKEPVSYTAQGSPIALLMVDWHAGRLTSEECRILGNALIILADIRGMFASEREHDLIAALIEAIFTPSILATTLHPIDEAVELLRKISTLRDTDTGKPHRCMILSNIDNETITMVHSSEQGRKIFQHFAPADIATSADLGTVKPRADIYSRFIEKYSLNPAECIFIDDRPENCIAAAQAGIQGIVITPSGYGDVLTEIERYSQ
jgi:FMN phosphatase YigB (HAD superfamily)